MTDEEFEEMYSERAAIAQYCGGLAIEEAEALARSEADAKSQEVAES